MTYPAMRANSWQVCRRFSRCHVPRRRRKSSTLQVVLLALLAGVAGATYVLVRVSSNARAPLALPRDCNLGPTDLGIDVSYYQGDITWSRVAKSDVQFAFIRVYDGTQIFDEKFVANWNGARRSGVARGAYQFFRPEQSPVDQADLLIAALKKYGAGELPPALDLETTGSLPLDVVVQRAKIWIDRVRSALGVEPILYTNPGMWRFRPLVEFATQPLWLAHYTSACPELPRGFVRWSYWQFTENGRIPGIEGPVDLDVRAR
jgi:GH25 family lysozyme M1 (1,4-beta-N-acetylmuramidase)